MTDDLISEIASPFLEWTEQGYAILDKTGFARALLAAGASEVHIATVYEDNDGTKHVQLDVENFDDLPVGMKLYARYENGL